jgi:hypothetical protein
MGDEDKFRFLKLHEHEYILQDPEAPEQAMILCLAKAGMFGYERI